MYLIATSIALKYLILTKIFINPLDQGGKVRVKLRIHLTLNWILPGICMLLNLVIKEWYGGGFGNKRVQVMDTSGTLSMVIMACVGQG